MRTILLVLLGLFAGACSTQPADSASPDEGVTTNALVESLSRAGLQVKAAGEIEQPFWTRRAQVFTVEGDDLQLYEFADEAAATRAAEQVAPDGGSIGQSSMSWIAPPHFYRSGRTIAIYLGTNRAVLDALQSLLGAPFAERR